MKSVIRLGASFCLLSASTAFAADVIKLIVPTGPGGGTDVFFRMIARDAEPILNASILVQNVGGAGGTIGVSQVVRSAPNGLTIGGVFMGPITVAPHTVKTQYKMTDYIPVIQLTSAPYVLCVRQDFPANDGKSFIEELQKNPGKYTYGTDGVAGAGQLSVERVFQALKIKAVDVPFKGAGETMPALLSKTIDIYSGSVPPGVNFEKNGQGKCLLSTSADRVAALPKAISLRELGIPQLETMLWRGVIVPASTPAELVLKLQKAFEQAAAAPATKKFVEDAGEQMVIVTGTALRERIQQEFTEMGKLVTSLGLQPK
jgi:tripartite-type tricarboxylate transporter receptor subunit TctC